MAHTREAACHCGQLRVTTVGEPFAVGLCHCRDCQRRTVEPDLVVVSTGAFADPSFPPPTESGYESRRHAWVGLPDTIGRTSPEQWEVGDLYATGRYAEAAERGRFALTLVAGDGRLLYNVACCESRAGETGQALEHLGRAIAVSDAFRARARDDADFDPIRADAAFQALTAG